MNHQRRKYPTLIQVRNDSVETFVTSFDHLAKLCNTKELNPLEVLGSAMTASHKMVKHERALNEGFRIKPYDYEESQKTRRYTEIKITLASAGFAYTEIVLYTCKPYHDDDSVAMSIAESYGGTVPEMVTVESDAKKVCFKITRHILKKHIHMSPSTEVDTALTIPTISSNAGKFYQRSRGEGSERMDTKFS